MSPLVELGSSRIHGTGVFATEPVGPETRLCRYGGYLMDNALFQLEVMSGRLDPALCDYRLSHPLQEGRVVVGHLTPRSPEAVGQFINDGHRPRIFEEEMCRPRSGGLPYFRQELSDYQRRSEQARNVFFRPEGDSLVCYSRRRLGRGEELLYTYGIDYWVEKFQQAEGAVY